MAIGSGITLVETDPANIPTPTSGKDTIFIDSTNSNTPSYKDGTGTVHTLKGAAGVQGPVGPVPFIDDGDIGEQGFPGQPGQQGPPGVASSGNVSSLLIRKNYWSYYDDRASGVFQDYGTVTSNIGSTSSVNDATTNRARRTTVAGDNNAAGEQGQFVGSAGQFRHLPDVSFNIFTGSDITSLEIWAGLFDSATVSTNPGTSHTGVNTHAHAAFRFASAVDGASWIGSVADGTTQAISGNINAIAASTQYVLRVRFSSNTAVNFSVNGGAEVTVNIPTSGADSNTLTWGIYVLNNGGGITRFIDIVSIFGSYN